MKTSNYSYAQKGTRRRLVILVKKQNSREDKKRGRIRYRISYLGVVNLNIALLLSIGQ